MYSLYSQSRHDKVAAQHRGHVGCGNGRLARHAVADAKAAARHHLLCAVERQELVIAAAAADGAQLAWVRSNK